MPVRSTYSSQADLAGILAALGPLSSVAVNTEDTRHKLDEVVGELKRTRLGHELHLWGQEVEEAE